MRTLLTQSSLLCDKELMKKRQDERGDQTCTGLVSSLGEQDNPLLQHTPYTPQRQIRDKSLLQTGWESLCTLQINSNKEGYDGITKALSTFG